jgi:hypothetical protein
VIAEQDGLFRVRSKGIGIGAHGSSGTVVCEDLIRKTRTARESLAAR